jgi:5-methylcytosine-specific restriction endonuclease McrA
MARTNTRRMHVGRQEFFEQGRADSQSADPEVRALSDCWLCHSPIDYVADPHSTPDSHNLDHFKPVRDYPELQEDPSNWKHSHRACNQSRGADTPSLGLGEPMPDWW